MSYPETAATDADHEAKHTVTDGEGEKMSTTATLNYGEITALASLYTAAADTDKGAVAPILSAVHVQITEGHVTAHATDHYVCARVRFDMMHRDDEAAPAELVLPGAWLAQIAATVRRAGRTWHGRQAAAVILTAKDGALSAWVQDGDGGATMNAREVEGNYPPVGRLFPDFADAKDGEPIALGDSHAVDFDNLARIAKLRHPGDTLAGKSATRFGLYRFAAAHKDANAPLIATRRGGDVAALIQPNRANIYGEV